MRLIGLGVQGWAGVGGEVLPSQAARRQAQGIEPSPFSLPSRTKSAENLRVRFCIAASSAPLHVGHVAAIDMVS